MSESLSLGQALENCVNEWYAANGGGFTNGFIALVDYLNDNGENKLLVAKAPGQPIHRSMGYTAYLDLWYKDDAQRVWASGACTSPGDLDD